MRAIHLLSAISLAAVAWLALAIPEFAAAQDSTPRRDRHGDPLPEGALLRIGTVRLCTGGPIRDMVFTADGRKLGTADRVSGVHIWEVATGKELKAWPNLNKDDPKCRQPSPFATIRLSPRGTHVAEVNNRGLCSVRELATGKELCRIDRRHWQNLSDVRFAPNGKTLALLKNVNGVVTIHDVGTGKLLNTLPRHSASYPFLAFTPDGKSLTVAAQNIPVFLYDVATGKRVGQFGDAKQGAQFGSGQFSPDGKLFAFFSDHYAKLEIWDAVKFRRLTVIKGRFNSSPLTFSADSRWIISAFDGDKLGIWETATGKLMRTHTERFGGFWRTAVSPDGKYLATAHGQVITLRHLDTGKLKHNLHPHAGHMIRVQFGLDNKSLLSISDGRSSVSDTSAFLWDAVTGKQLADVGWAGGSWPVGAVSADGRVRVEGRGGEKIVVRERASEKILLQMNQPTWVARTAAFTPQGKYLALTLHEPRPNGRFKIQLWHVATAKKVLERNEYGRVEFDTTGRRLYLFTGARQIRGYDVATGQPIPRSDVKVGNSYGVGFSPFGHIIAEVDSGGNRLVHLRELTTGQIVDTLTSTRGGNIIELAISPTGRLLAAGTADGIIIIWDVITGRELAVLTGHRSFVDSLSWSPNGQRLVSGSRDMTLLVWNAEPWLTETVRKQTKPTPGELTTLWEHLAETHGNRGYRASLRLVQTPKAAVALLQKHLRPTTRQEMARVRTLVKNLDHNRFRIRVQADQQLQQMGDLALAALKKALAVPHTLEAHMRMTKLQKKLTTEPPPPTTLRQLRALTVLEMISTRDAVALLDVLARGDPDSWLTQEARTIRRRIRDR